MTTILKALQELEGRAAAAGSGTAAVAAPAAPVATASPPERLPLSPARVRTRALLALSAAVFAGGALYWLRADRDAIPRPQAPRSRSAHAPGQETGGVAQVAPLQPQAPRPEVAGEDRVAPRADPRPNDALAPAEPAPRADLLPRINARPAPAMPPAVAAPLREESDAGREARPAAASAPRDSAPAANGSGIHVTSITYSPNVANRSAALRIDGRAVTVRQGDSVSGLEVQLIMPDAVYVRRGAEIFAVDARR